MTIPTAELSSVTSALTDLTRRVGTMADQAAARQEDDVAADLFAVERALTGATRRLTRLTTPSRRAR
jgi:hypothetical protein